MLFSSSNTAFQAKKGLGAQKVKQDFKEIEEAAQKAFELKDSVKQQNDEPLTNEQVVDYIQNINLAYKSLSEQQHEKEEKLRKLDPEKAEQIERLGMGFIEKSSSHISHSAIGDMKTIEQVNPHSTKSSSLRNIDRDLGLLDIDSGFSRSSKKSNSFDDKDDFWSCLNSPTTSSSSSRSSKVPQVIDTIPALETSPAKISRQAMAFGSSSSSSSSHNASSQSSSSSSWSHPMDSEAQKKFGSAKAISSAQFFNDQGSSGFEEKARLNQFQNVSSLSSDEYFGRNTNKPAQGYSSSLSGANLYDIKEGVKDSVTKVGQRLSNIASDVMSSIQEKYGGY